MSVKDKIAMWNNIGSNNNTLPSPKIVSNAPVSKPKESPQTPTLPQSTPQINQNIETQCVVKPSLLKQKSAVQQIQMITKTSSEQATKVWASTSKAQQGIKKESPTIPPTNQKNVIKPQSLVKQTASNSLVTNPTSSQFQIETSITSKPSDIKKKLQQGGIGFQLIAPQPIKRVQSITVPQNTNVTANTSYQIETDAPRVSVKENAQRLAQFYNKKKEEQLKKKIEIQQLKYQQTKIQDKNTEAQMLQSIPQETTQTQTTIDQNNEVQKTEQTVPTVKAKEEVDLGSLDIAARLKHKHKQKRRKFDSDDD